MRLLLLSSVSFFCLTCLVACQNTAAPDQLTVVQGTVTSADSGRPLGRVLLAIESYRKGFPSYTNFELTGDSTRTDAQGRYQLSFRNKKGLYYRVVADPLDWNKPSQTPRLAFETNLTNGEITVGKTNTVDFKPNELRTVAVRIRNRNTGYQRLDFGSLWLRGSNLDTLAYLRNFYLPASGVKFYYYKLDAAKQVTKDTAVALAVQNPAALPPDTVRATLTFGR